MFNLHLLLKCTANKQSGKLLLCRELIVCVCKHGRPCFHWGSYGGVVHATAATALVESASVLLRSVNATEIGVDMLHVNMTMV